MTVRQYSDLVAWQRAFPKEELYGLSSQLRRAAVSVPSNIAEGQSRSSREFVHHLAIAHGSLSELETQILIAARLGYIDPSHLAEVSKRTAEVGRLIHGLSRSIEKLATGHRSLATAI
jgi:four helix bundle protein